MEDSFLVLRKFWHFFQCWLVVIGYLFNSFAALCSLFKPACLVYLQISDEHTLREQGFTQDCNIHVHFSLYGGIKA